MTRCTRATPTFRSGPNGQSAGGQLALLLGAARDLAFVISDAGPTDWDTWRSTYPCFYRNCALITGTAFTGVGAYWVDVSVAETFGAATDPAPNLTDYDPAPSYDSTHGPDPFLVYGRRYRQGDPARTPIADGTPRDGVDANAYIDDDDDPATTADQLETDTLVTQQQGTLLAGRVGARAVLRTLPRGTVPWVHAYVDGSIASDVYTEMYGWATAEAAAAHPLAPAKANLGVPELDGVPIGSYVVRTCDAAPAGSGIFATGAWQPRLSAGPGMDAAEAGCSSASSGQGLGEGMEMRTRPSAASTIAAGATARMTFTTPPQATITEYDASYHGARTTREWSMSLVASNASAQTALLSCNAGAPCRYAPDALVPSDTPDADLGPFPTQRFAVPAGTTSLSWQLVCEQAGGCANQDASFLDVYASSITIADQDAPAPAILTGDFADGRGHDGRLVGAVEASDGGSGVRRVDVTFAGATITSATACDFSVPRPCPARHTFGIDADASALAGGPHRVTVTITDGSGRSTTTTTDVLVAYPPAPVAAGDQTVATAQPSRTEASGAPTSSALGAFVNGHGGDQLAACATPQAIASRLRGKRLVVQAIASRRLAGSTATLRSAGRRVASARIAADGRVRLAGQLRSAELDGDFTVWAGARTSPRMLVRPAVTLMARRHASTVRLSGATPRGAGRQVELEQLTGCGRWRHVGRTRATARRRFAATLAAGPAPGGAYRAVVVAGARRGAPARRASSVVALT
jgi:hypothetical protein